MTTVRQVQNYFHVRSDASVGRCRFQEQNLKDLGRYLKPAMIIMMYVRAERESDWPLHIAAVEQMLPYMFASGHVNYACYGLYYLRNMQAMPPDVLKHFMKGELTMHHIPGIYNGIWSDMFIEST